MAERRKNGRHSRKVDGRQEAQSGWIDSTNSNTAPAFLQRRKPSPRYVLQSFIDFLLDNLDGFDQYPHSTQFHLAELAFEIGKKSRRHRKYDGFYTVGYQEIRRRFRRRFNAINEHLDFFDVTSDWSKKEKRTRGIRLSAKLTILKTAFLESDPVLSELVDESGEVLRKLPRNGIDTEVSRTNRKNTHIKAVVPISHRALNNLIKWLISAGAALEVDASHLLEVARTIRHYSHTKPSGKKLIHRYSLANSGRLYAKGVNLQNAPNIVTDAALSGCWEYDLENCHFVIFSNLAARVGIICTAISHYIRRKDDMRDAIAEDVGLNPKVVKKCLIALMYGAMESSWHEAAIPKLAGDKAPELYRHPLFSKLAIEIQTARRAIISQWPDTSQRSYINAMGRPISKTEDNRFIMAHLQQGIEAKMLHIAIDMFGEQIVLLKHDGFSTSCRIDKKKLADRIFDETGITVEVSERQHRFEQKKMTRLHAGGDREQEGNNTGALLTDQSRQVKWVSSVIDGVKHV